MELKKYKLGDIAEIIVSSIDKKSKEGEEPIKLCNFVNVYHNWAISTDMVQGFMNATTSEKNIERFSLKKGYVAFTKDSETRDDIGIPTYIADSLENTVLGYHCALVKPNEKILSGKYLNAFLHSNYIKKYFELNATGSGMRYTLSMDTLNNIPVLIPSLKIQKRIGGIFSDIDCKISLNRAINHNLEAMAKQLYDYWFVQFDFPDENGRPYKSSGGEVVWNEKLKREIPEKWSDNTLEYFLNIKNGRDHKHLLCGSYPVYGSGGEMRRVCEWLYDGESVLMPRKGTLNNIMYVNEAFWTVDTMFYSVMKKEHCAKYIYYSIRDIDFTRWDAGTGVPSMTSSTLYSIPIIVPQENVLQAFDEKITPLFVAIKHNSKEISELTKQRDELLPLLMNGQVSVNYDLSHD